MLSTEKRREVADRIRVAREFGDISENAEYDDAKNEQAMLEHKIAQLEERLSNARVIQKRDVDLSVVSDRRQGQAARRRRQAHGRVLHRRLRRGESRRAQALERVAGRQGDHRQEEGRDRRGGDSARLAEVQDHRHRSRLARRVFERFTERARQVVVLAQDEARSLGHGYIGTEHLLLGLLREEEGLGARVLASLGVTVDEVAWREWRASSAAGTRSPSGPDRIHAAREASARALAAAKRSRSATTTSAPSTCCSDSSGENQGRRCADLARVRASTRRRFGHEVIRMLVRMSRASADYGRRRRVPASLRSRRRARAAGRATRRYPKPRWRPS